MFIIYATVSSWSCFCWLYRASPSLAAKNIINLFSALTIWWCTCVKSFLVLFGKVVCYDQCILLAELYEHLPCFILYSKAKFAFYYRCFLTSYFCIPVPNNEKDIFFVLILEGLVVTVDIKKDKASGIRAQNFGREGRARVQSLTGLITVSPVLTMRYPVLMLVLWAKSDLMWILKTFGSVSSVTQSCATLCDPMDCSTQGFPVHCQYPEFTQTHVSKNEIWIISSCNEKIFRIFWLFLIYVI